MKSLLHSFSHQLLIAIFLGFIYLIGKIATALISPLLVYTSELTSAEGFALQQGWLTYIGYVARDAFSNALILTLLFRLLMWPFTYLSFRKWNSMKIGFYIFVMLLVFTPWVIMTIQRDGELLHSLLTALLFMPSLLFLAYTHWHFHTNKEFFMSPKPLFLWAGIIIAGALLHIVQNHYYEVAAIEKKKERDRKQAAYESRPIEWHHNEVKKLFNKYDHVNMESVLKRLEHLASESSDSSDFVKIDANGAILDNDAKRWSCVWDRTTGLVWQAEPQTRKSNYFKRPQGYSFDAENQSNLVIKESYSGISALSIEEIRADRFVTPDDIKSKPKEYSLAPKPKEKSSLNEAIESANQKQLCGVKSWQVPNVLEGLTLMDKSAKNYFKFYDKAYWTSSPAMLTNRKIYGAMIIEYDSNTKSAQADRAKYRYPVRLMSRKFTPKTPAEIVLLGGGFMLDRETKLLWRHCPIQSDPFGDKSCDDGAAQISYAEALKYHDGILGDNIDPDDAGYEQWRAPTTEEFRNLYACINAKVSCRVVSELWPKYDRLKSFEPYTNGLFLTINGSGDKAKASLV